eukprot:gb/GEZN01001402.1/.p1 GENE.gb/GEZN01001402.1/~~gb/GEZN01001402.1/.p1  ORF type:complete len:908 (+),score=140.62 gb/GEZN01001402.1/:96-2819(+)
MEDSTGPGSLDISVEVEMAGLVSAARSSSTSPPDEGNATFFRDIVPQAAHARMSLGMVAGIFEENVRRRLLAADFLLLRDTHSDLTKTNMSVIQYLQQVVNKDGRPNWSVLMWTDLKPIPPSKAKQIAATLRGDVDMEGYKSLQRWLTHFNLAMANMLWKLPGIIKLDLTVFTLRNDTTTDFVVSVKFGCKGGGIYHTPFFEQDPSGIDSHHFLLHGGEEKVFATATPPDGCTMTISGFLLVLGFHQRPVFPGCFVVRETADKQFEVVNLAKNWKLKTWAPSFKYANWEQEELAELLEEAGVSDAISLSTKLIARGFISRTQLRNLNADDLKEFKLSETQEKLLIKFVIRPLQGSDKLIWDGPAPTPEAATPQYFRVLKPKAHLTEKIGKLPDVLRTLSQSDDIYVADVNVIEHSQTLREEEEARRRAKKEFVKEDVKEMFVKLPLEIEAERLEREERRRLNQDPPKVKEMKPKDFKIYNGEIVASLNCWMWVMHSLSHTWAFLNKQHFMHDENLSYSHMVRPTKTAPEYIPIDARFLEACTDATLDTAYELPEPEPVPKPGDVPQRPLYRTDLQFKDLELTLILTRIFGRFLDVYNEYGLLIISWLDDTPQTATIVLLLSSAVVTGFANGSRSPLPAVQGRFWFGDGEDWIDQPSEEEAELPESEWSKAAKYYYTHGGGFIGMTQYTDGMLRYNLPLLLASFTQIFVLGKNGVLVRKESMLVWWLAQIYLGIVAWTLVCVVAANSWRDKGFLPCTTCAPEVGRTRGTFLMRGFFTLLCLCIPLGINAIIITIPPITGNWIMTGLLLLIFFVRFSLEPMMLIVGFRNCSLSFLFGVIFSPLLKLIYKFFTCSFRSELEYLQEMVQGMGEMYSKIKNGMSYLFAIVVVGTLAVLILVFFPDLYPVLPT